MASEDLFFKKIFLVQTQNMNEDNITVVKAISEDRNVFVTLDINSEIYDLTCPRFLLAITPTLKLRNNEEDLCSFLEWDIYDYARTGKLEQKYELGQGNSRKIYMSIAFGGGAWMKLKGNSTFIPRLELGQRVHVLIRMINYDYALIIMKQMQRMTPRSAVFRDTFMMESRKVEANSNIVRYEARSQNRDTRFFHSGNKEENRYPIDVGTKFVLALAITMYFDKFASEWEMSQYEFAIAGSVSEVGMEGGRKAITISFGDSWSMKLRGSTSHMPELELQQSVWAYFRRLSDEVPLSLFQRNPLP